MQIPLIHLIGSGVVSLVRQKSDPGGVGQSAAAFRCCAYQRRHGARAPILSPAAGEVCATGGSGIG